MECRHGLQGLGCPGFVAMSLINMFQYSNMVKGIYGLKEMKHVEFILLPL